MAAVAEYERSARRHDLDLNKSDLDSIDIKDLGLELGLLWIWEIIRSSALPRGGGVQGLLVPVPQPTSILQFKN